MNWFKSITGFLLIVLAFAYAVYLNLTNIDMTNLRLLMTLWKSYLIISIMLISGHFLVNYHQKR